MTNRPPPPSARPANDSVSPPLCEEGPSPPALHPIGPAEELLLQTGALLFTANPFRLEPGGPPTDPEHRRLVAIIVSAVVNAARDRMAAGDPFTEEQRRAYRDAALHLLWESAADDLRETAATGVVPQGAYPAFVRRHEHLFLFEGSTIEVYDAAHCFALAYVARRASDGILETILGCGSLTAGLQGDVWDAVWDGDVHGFATWGFARTEHSATLVVGPTGAGKEGVARILGRARYIPFDEEMETFASRPGDGLHVVNVSALPPALADSLLFGHVRGAFTGADRDRAGALSRCKDGGTLFLDEIGDLDPDVQVKLLRVLQEWEFTPLGETEPVPFRGSIVAATQPSILHAGKLRDDLYYRVCQRLVEVPSLRARIDDDPDELVVLVAAMALMRAGPARALALFEKVLHVLATPELRDHPWPGNVRELQTCVSNVHTHGRYVPRSRIAAPAGEDTAAPEEEEGILPLVVVKRRHALAALEATDDDVVEAARLLGIDPKTLRRLVDEPAPAPAPSRVTDRSG